MKIGIDLDEILAGFLEALVDYHNKTYKTFLKRSQFHSYDFWKVWGGNRNEAIQKVYDFHKSCHFSKIKPIPGAISGIEEIKENHELIIITSRQDYIAKETRAWIEKHFPNTFTKIHFTNHFAQKGKQKSKADICVEEQIDLLIEDHPEYAVECSSRKIKVFLLDNPWNKLQKMPKEVERVFSWQEIVKKIKSYS